MDLKPIPTPSRLFKLSILATSAVAPVVNSSLYLHTSRTRATTLLANLPTPTSSSAKSPRPIYLLSLSPLALGTLCLPSRPLRIRSLYKLSRRRLEGGRGIRARIVGALC